MVKILRQWFAPPKIFFSLTTEQLELMKRAAAQATQELKDRDEYERELALRAEVSRLVKQVELESAA